jgi:glutathione S-transferase
MRNLFPENHAMKLTLCYAPQTCATVPFITLTEAGADFDVMNLNSRTGQLKSPEFLRLNPKHKVPVLIIDGEALTENLALQVWIARHFPAAKLLPADPMLEIKAISLMSFFGSGIHPHLTPNARPENYLKILPSLKICSRRTRSRSANGFSITSPRATRIFSGASGAQFHSSWICRSLKTATRISSVCVSARVCKNWRHMKNK